MRLNKILSVGVLSLLGATVMVAAEAHGRSNADIERHKHLSVMAVLAFERRFLL